MAQAQPMQVVQHCFELSNVRVSCVATSRCRRFEDQAKSEQEVVYEVEKWNGKILRDIRELTQEFESQEELRTCRSCNYVQTKAEGPGI